MCRLSKKKENSNLFNKNHAQDNVKCHIHYEKKWLRWIKLNRCLYFLKEIVLAHFQNFFGRSNRDEKMKAKHIKEDSWKRFFGKLAGWHLSIPFQITSFTDNFQELELNERLHFSFCIKCLRNTCEIVFYCICCFVQFVHEISSFVEVHNKGGVLKNFSKFTDKHKKQSWGGVLSKDVLKYFVKLYRKTSVLKSLFNKVAVLRALLRHL